MIPATAYRPVKVREQTDWCFTLGGRNPSLGKVRIVVSFEEESLTSRSKLSVFVHNQLSYGATIDHVSERLFAKQRHVVLV